MIQCIICLFVKITQKFICLSPCKFLGSRIKTYLTFSIGRQAKMCSKFIFRRRASSVDLTFVIVNFCRLLSCIVFIPFEARSSIISEDQAVVWQLLFNSLLERVLSVVGDVIRAGSWLLSPEGKQSFNECLKIVIQGFGEEGKGSRFAKTWACALMSARKVNSNNDFFSCRLFNI